MTETEIKKEMEQLAADIEYNSKLYYENDAPVIEDSEYDAMFARLKMLESMYPHLASPVSPTRRVGGAVASRFEKVRHEVRMCSLTDVFSFDEVRAFDRGVREVCPDVRYVVEYKIDGLSVSLEYRNGVFFRGLTRGDGIFGEDVSENLKTVKNIPLKLNKSAESIDRLIVRGEVYMPKSVFASLNEEREAEGQTPFANPRNAAAGSLRQLDPAVCAKRKLDIFVFNLQYSSLPIADKHSDSLEALKKFGFKVSERRSVFSDIGEVIKEIADIGETRSSLPFDIDGAVIKTDGFADREQIGETTSVPKWAAAYKYPPETVETLLKDIVIQVGRTGVLTPNAVLEPVRLSGSTVSKATLHNIDNILQKDIRIGDTVLVRKAGDIIPEIVGSVKEKRKADSVSFSMPSVCPSCGGKVVREKDEAAVRCTNSSCPAQLQRNIEHFVSRDCMNIDSLGESITAKLIEEGLIRDAADIYYLRAEDISALDGMGEKSAANIIASIERSKHNPLSKLLFALGIRHIGEKAGILLARRFGSIDGIMNATAEELCGIDDIGEISALSVVEYFAHPDVKDMIERMKKAGVNMSGGNDKKSDKLAGMNIVVTGTLPTLKRSEAESLIREHGGNAVSSVSKKTSYVLCGEAPGSKLTKANELGIPVIDEAEFLKMISDE